MGHTLGGRPINYLSMILNRPDPYTQSPEDFERTVTNLFQIDLPKLINDYNNNVSSMNQAIWAKDETERFKNEAISEVTTLKNEAISTTTNLKNEAISTTTSLKNEAQTARDEAVSAANRAEAVVIPTEATYSEAEIDGNLNVMLSNVIENTIQISILGGK